MTTSPDHFIDRLLDTGLSRELVDAALPEWWQPADANSTSARTLASLLLARRLSLDPRTLLDDNQPVGFLHSGPIKFKHMRLVDGPRREALVAFARGVGRIALGVMATGVAHDVPQDPLVLRQALMGSGGAFVSFGDVLTACWSLGIPVLHLRVFPSTTKGVTAIAVRLGQRHAILVARETGIDAQYMFHVAHELGHIALGHLRDAGAIVDADPLDPNNRADELVDDDEEVAADAYAQQLLTGQPSFNVLGGQMTSAAHGSAKELAELALQAGPQLGIDPGHIVMCYGHSTQNWSRAMAAAKLLPRQPSAPSALVNRVLWSQLKQEHGAMDEQARAYLEAVAPI